MAAAPKPPAAPPRVSPSVKMEVEDRILAFRQLSPSFISASFHFDPPPPLRTRPCAAIHRARRLTRRLPIRRHSCSTPGGHYPCRVRPTRRARSRSAHKAPRYGRRTPRCSGVPHRDAFMLRFPRAPTAADRCFRPKALWDLGLDFDQDRPRRGHVGAIHEGRTASLAATRSASRPASC